MALSITTINHTYTGDGSTVSFSIPFTFFSNTQVKVLATNTSTGVATELTQGVEFTVTGGDPGTAVLAATAPTASETWKVYRSTPLTQIYDFLNSTTVNLETIEKALDRLAMMAQEIAGGAVSSSSSSGGSYQIGTLQTVAAAGTVGIVDGVLRQVAKVQGDVGGTTADLTVPIEAGTVDGQELVLLGQSDVDPLTIPGVGANLNINGSAVLLNGDALALLLDHTNSKWIELNRR
jgi:hypothetical protein